MGMTAEEVATIVKRRHLFGESWKTIAEDMGKNRETLTRTTKNRVKSASLYVGMAGYASEALSEIAEKLDTGEMMDDKDMSIVQFALKAAETDALKVVREIRELADAWQNKDVLVEVKQKYLGFSVGDRVWVSRGYAKKQQAAGFVDILDIPPMAIDVNELLLSGRAKSALEEAGVKTIAAASEWLECGASEQKGVGKKTICEIGDQIKRFLVDQ